MEETKKCNECGGVFDISNFRRWKETKRGKTKIRVGAKCIECSRKSERLRAERARSKNPEKYKAYVKKYQKQNKEKLKEYYYTKVHKKSNIRFIVCECGVKECVKDDNNNKRSKCKECYALYKAEIARDKARLFYNKNRNTKNRVCLDCGNEFDGFNGKIRCDSCSKKHIRKYRKKFKKKRRALLRGAKQGIAFNDIDVFRRDKWRCKECGVKVQKKNIYADDAAELDHIVPVSKGGPHIPSNTQTLCRKCNQDKSDTIRGQISLFVNQSDITIRGAIKNTHALNDYKYKSSCWIYV